MKIKQLHNHKNDFKNQSLFQALIFNGHSGFDNGLTRVRVMIVR